MSAAAGLGRDSTHADLRARQPKAIHSALTVLEEVARCGPGVSARTISDNLGLPRATAYRLLNLLVQEEYLVRLPDLSGFALSRKVAQLAALAEPEVTITRAARAVLSGMRSHFRGGVTLVGYHGDRLRFLDTDPDYPPSDATRIASELDASALGRLLLSERRRIQPLGAPATAAGDEALREVLRLGYTTRFDALRQGHGCLAMPVRDAHGSLVAGVALSAPSDRLREAAPLVQLLRQGTAELGPLLA